jgi:ribosomal protein S18 acetylase RimI-like enzyme
VPAAPEGGFALRPATPGDAEQISAVLTAAGVESWGPFLGAERVRAANAGRRHPADLVAVDADGVLGFVAWDARTGEVLRLYTHPRAWGRGAGRALLDAALQALRHAGRTQAWLNTEARNTRARRFYERHGFRVEGPPRVREWHGARLTEPRYVRDL